LSLDPRLPRENVVPLTAYKWNRLSSKAIEESARLLRIDNVKEEQKFAATTFRQGKDTFISLLTGFGKSLVNALLP